MGQSDGISLHTPDVVMAGSKKEQGTYFGPTIIG